MSPVTAEDHLFKGLALSTFIDPRDALPLLNHAVEMRDGPLARLVRAVPVRRLLYPSGFDRLPEVIKSLHNLDVNLL